MVGSTPDDGAAGEADLLGVLDEGRRRFLSLVADVRPELLRYCARMGWLRFRGVGVWSGGQTALLDHGAPTLDRACSRLHAPRKDEFASPTGWSATLSCTAAVIGVSHRQRKHAGC